LAGRLSEEDKLDDRLVCRARSVELLRRVDGAMGEIEGWLYTRRAHKVDLGAWEFDAGFR
jgi:hypothetical protein